jgi:carnosine N-methyltransferase
MRLSHLLISSLIILQFVEVYSKEQEKAAWNAVTTCFFIDTAHNLTRYLEVINHALVLGGVWINVGPLLWHYEGAAHGDLSIELTLDEVLGLIGLMGFHIEVRSERGVFD